MKEKEAIKKVDCTGLYCPQPVFVTRSAIDELKPGEIIEVTADDPAAEEDIKSLVESLGEELVDFRKEGDNLIFLIKKRER
ncbi:MAG: sulfurtransferase TusA family protein [Candidatus Odinarchaeia archaeon]